MTVTHDQAMSFIYEQVLERLMGHMSPAQRASVQLLVQRLLVSAGGAEHIGTFRLLVVHGNDRRSARLLAVLRAAQLCIALRAPATFQLRVLIACLPGPSRAVMQQHERCFNALFMADDPRVQLQIIEGAEAVSFDCRTLFHCNDWVMHRRSLLLFGHLREAGCQALLGSRLHLELASAVCRVIDDSEARSDALVTALPKRERLRYLAWARRLLRLAEARGTQPAQQCLAALLGGLSQLHTIAESPLEMLHPQVNVVADEKAPLCSINLDDLLSHLRDESQLDVMLQCAGETTQDGSPLAAFLDSLALSQLANLLQQCASSSEQAPSLAEEGSAAVVQAALLARSPNVYGLEPAHIGCLLFRPFVNRGQALETYLSCCHPDMLVALPYLLRALQGQPCPDAIKDWLVNTSGLPLMALQAIFDGRVPLRARRLLASLARRDASLALRPSGEAKR